MGMRPQSVKNKGRQGEHDVAAMLGAKRMVLSGSAGGNDLWIPSDGIYSGLAVEVKRRARLPAIATVPLAQAEAAARNTGRYPMVAYREDRGRWVFAMWGEQFVSFTGALAEVGQGANLRTLLREIERSVEQARGLL